jgi:hypothetical protein
MSYTSQVKDEILSKPILSFEEKLSEIKAVLLTKNHSEGKGFELRLESISLADRVYRLLKEMTNLKINIKYSTSKKFGEHNIYIIAIPPQKGFSDFLQLLESYDLERYLTSEPAAVGFTRGMFLACGYIKSPAKEYALDFFIDDESSADDLYTILKFFNKKAFKTIKRNKPLVYLRNSEDIMDILVLIGSIQSFYNYEETTMMKDLKNKTIREMNWEVANETKTLNTGNKQIKMIEFIQDKMGLKNLSPVLEEVAILRLNNPESTLEELGKIIGISKSGIRNRFRRIEDIYISLGGED